VRLEPASERGICSHQRVGEIFAAQLAGEFLQRFEVAQLILDDVEPTEPIAFIVTCPQRGIGVPKAARISVRAPRLLRLGDLANERVRQRDRLFVLRLAQGAPRPVIRQSYAFLALPPQPISNSLLVFEVWASGAILPIEPLGRPPKPRTAKRKRRVPFAGARAGKPHSRSINV
jgi:hypothetical protein